MTDQQWQENVFVCAQPTEAATQRWAIKTTGETVPVTPSQQETSGQSKRNRNNGPTNGSHRVCPLPLGAFSNRST